jgi:hypothetical protein
MSPTIASHVATAVAALERVPRVPADFAVLSDAALLELSATAATMQRLVGTHAALVAGEIARRSSRELGASGLAQRSGYRTPEELVRVTTGSTAREASHAVRVGVLAHDAASSLPAQPWLAVVSAGLVAGTLSGAAADAIRGGLGVPTTEVSVATLSAAATQLCAEAGSLDADRLFRRARELRDDLDEAGIADREAARREQRSMRFSRLPDGMAQLTWRLDPETAAVVGDLYDRATSPRRGGPRFMHGGNAALADALLADTRTTEQLASDTFVELLRHGAAADSTRLLGTGAPVVRVIATRTTINTRTGHGFIEGHPDPISIETIERLSCGGAVQNITIDQTGQPLDLGREQRLFTRRQRDALALRDGGCRWPGCDRPPSWTEAHHTQHWARDHGTTNLNNGVLLCRHHHLLLHNNHWEIEHGRSSPKTESANTASNHELWLVPPPNIDPQQNPRPMPTKSPLMRELVRA